MVNRKNIPDDWPEEEVIAQRIERLFATDASIEERKLGQRAMEKLIRMLGEERIPERLLYAQNVRDLLPDAARFEIHRVATKYAESVANLMSTPPQEPVQKPRDESKLDIKIKEYRDELKIGKTYYLPGDDSKKPPEWEFTGEQRVNAENEMEFVFFGDKRGTKGATLKELYMCNTPEGRRLSADTKVSNVRSTSAPHHRRFDKAFTINNETFPRGTYQVSEWGGVWFIIRDGKDGKPSSFLPIPGDVHPEQCPIVDDDMVAGKESAERVKEPVILDGENVESLADALHQDTTSLGDAITAGTDRGEGKKKNEDRIVINAEKNFVAVIDGVGGYGDGDKAAQVLAENLVRSTDDIDAAAEQAMMEMRAFHPKCGAVFISAKVMLDRGKKYLDICQSGDAKLFVIDEKGKVVYETKDESIVQKLVDDHVISEDDALTHGMRNVIGNQIRAYPEHKDEGKVTHLPRVEVRSGYRVYMYTDGVGDNLTSAEIAKNAGKRMTADQAAGLLADITAKRMRNSEAIEKAGRSNGVYKDGFRSRPKRDNRAIAIIDIA